MSWADSWARSSRELGAGVCKFGVSTRAMGGVGLWTSLNSFALANQNTAHTPAITHPGAV